MQVSDAEVGPTRQQLRSQPAGDDSVGPVQQRIDRVVGVARALTPRWHYGTGNPLPIPAILAVVGGGIRRMSVNN